MKLFNFLLISILVFNSCASKEDIYYLQDAEINAIGDIVYNTTLIQPNDILKITVESSEPLSSLPYNRGLALNTQQSIEVMKLNGYLVDINNTINFPVLGSISTKNLTTSSLAKHLKLKLIDGGHLNNPSVIVRLLNAKVTVLGEVNAPGTYNFTEQNITLLQAIGYAGDLTINGNRDDILVTREVNGIRQVSRINLTSADFMKSAYYFIKPNDVIMISPNKPMVASSGFVGNVGTVATVISLVLSVTILLTR
ncbi:polysaccharide biosynthesis/export family protein [Flavobacteriaceae bacterium]|nr:polysaccharide biosynthesis/export family protein [Flavobacteriaceae bacterium]